MRNCEMRKDKLSRSYYLPSLIGLNRSIALAMHDYSEYIGTEENLQCLK